MLYNNPLKTYTSPKGRPFRMFSLEEVPGTAKWIGRTKKKHYKAILIMLDNLEKIIVITGYNDEIIKKRRFDREIDTI